MLIDQIIDQLDVVLEFYPILDAIAVIWTLAYIFEDLYKFLSVLLTIINLCFFKDIQLSVLFDQIL